MTEEVLRSIPYVELMAYLGEINRPPGGKDSIRRLVQNCFLNHTSNVLDVGCNTGYCAFEIAHLAKCEVTGVDLSPEMISEANKHINPSDGNIKFTIADGMRLPFADNIFDLVTSGGSTAFISDKAKAIAEYRRVTKMWGFIADINFYYAKEPPKQLLSKLNELLGITILPWSADYWRHLYDNAELEPYYEHHGDVSAVSDEAVAAYCKTMAAEKELDKKLETILVERLKEAMLLFNENHRYLRFGVFIRRKRPEPEQCTLFGA